MSLEEILDAWAKMIFCPGCGSKEGFWLSAKRGHAYVQCKSCGASFELYQVYSLSGKGKEKVLHVRKIFGR